jgi:arylsulfatase A-like enzyme
MAQFRTSTGIVGGLALGLISSVALSLGAASAASATTLTSTVTSTPATVRPNVLNIVLDDMRDDTLAQMAAYMPKTVKWFAPGTFYVNADVSTPSCCPSRAAGMTGQYDHNNGMRHQQDIAKLNLNTTVQHYLHQAGYQTALVAKSLHNWTLSKAPPDFDRYSMWQSAAYTNPTVNVQGKVQKLTGYATTLTGNIAVQYLNALTADPQGRPWYEYVAFHAPHPDETGVAKPEAKYAASKVRHCAAPLDPGVSDMPPYVKWMQKTVAQSEALCESQLRALMSVDDQIDRVMTALQASGKLGNTMVVLWSDNGTMWGEHNRTSKFVPYLPSVNVPMFVRWDGHLPSATNTDLVSNVDIAPTIIEAAGVTPAPAVVIDGHSLLHPVTRPYELNEYWYDYPANGKVPDWAQIHNTHFAYIETYSSTGALAFQEYYNLDTDPGENRNLLKVDGGVPPSVLATVKAELALARTCAGVSCP